MELTEDLKGLIYRNIMQAKDKLKQVTIEAECNAIPVKVVRGILKERGVDLRILNGANLNKPKGERPEEQAKEHPEEPNNTDWDDLAIPPLENPPKGKLKYKKPVILYNVVETKDVEEILYKGDKKEDSDKCAEADNDIKDLDKVLDAFGQKVQELAEKRRALFEEIESIDLYLRKYAYFCSDLTEIITSEGVEI